MRTWIVLLLMGMAAVGVVVVVKHSDHTEQHLRAQPVAELSHESISPARAVATADTVSMSCSGQRLEVTEDADTESVCMGTLVTKHNGSVRSHEVTSLTAPQRWLRVEAAGGTILSAAWGSELQPEFHCQAAECTGITISRRDASGARVMTLERARLIQTQSNGAPSAQASLQLSGQVEIPADALPELACADQGVSIVTSDSSSQTFCPQGGAGFEIGDDGTKRYRFTSLDGESILVATDPNLQVRQVQYEGEASLACRSSECGSVRISVADADGARRFTFAGTTLLDTDNGQSNAVLNGSLILPPL